MLGQQQQQQQQFTVNACDIGEDTYEQGRRDENEEQTGGNRRLSILCAWDRGPSNKLHDMSLAKVGLTTRTLHAGTSLNAFSGSESEAESYSRLGWE